jgi:hypothetical protein
MNAAEQQARVGWHPGLRSSAAVGAVGVQRICWVAASFAPALLSKRDTQVHRVLLHGLVQATLSDPSQLQQSLVLQSQTLESQLHLTRWHRRACLAASRVLHM